MGIARRFCLHPMNANPRSSFGSGGSGRIGFQVAIRARVGDTGCIVKFGGVRPVFGILLLVLGTAAEPGDKFEKQFTRSEARFARRFATLALRAEKEKQAATARRIFQRVLLLDSEAVISAADREENAVWGFTVGEGAR